MADVLRRFVGPVALGTSASTLYTVPTGSTVVLLDVHACNESGSDASFTLSIGTDGAGKRLFKGEVVPANRAIQRTGNVALAAGEVLQGLASAGSAITLTISGVETL